MYDKYILSPQKHQKVFTKIRLKLFENKYPVPYPEIYVLGGQPGSGKSVLTQKIKTQLHNSNIVTINSDEFRLFHPQAQEIFNKYNKEFAAYTDPDMRLWGAEVLETAIKGRYNIIFEGTMRTTQICETIKPLLHADYKVHVMAMAVPALKSRISIYARYQEQLDKYPIARFTTRFSHDAAYQGMVDTLTLIEKERLYSTLTLCNRNGDVLFKNGDYGIKTALISEREKPLNPQDAQNLLQACDILLEKMQRRNENPEYIEDLTGLRQNVLETLSANSFAVQLQNLHTQVQGMKKVQNSALSGSEQTQSATPATLKSLVFEK